MSNKIEYYRKQKGWSQKELSERIGVVQSCISMYEKGKRNLPLTMAQRFAVVFGCSLNDLFEIDLKN